jgi:hypothetical protein
VTGGVVRTAATAAIVAGGIVGPTAATDVAGGIVGAAPAADVAHRIVGTAALTDMAGGIIATTALADVSGGIVGTAAGHGRAGRGGEGSQSRHGKDKAGLVTHGYSPVDRRAASVPAWQ